MSALAGQSPELTIIDAASDPPKILGGLALPVARGPGGLVGLAAEGHRLYLTADGGLIVYDVTEADAPREVGRVPLPGFGVGVAAAGGYVYTAAQELTVVDASDPAAPRIATTLPWRAERAEARNGVALLPDLILVGHWEAGLLLAGADIAPLPTFTPTPTTPPTATPLPSATPPPSETPLPPPPTPTEDPSAVASATPSPSDTPPPNATATEPPSPTTAPPTATERPAPSATPPPPPTLVPPTATPRPPASATPPPPLPTATRRAGASAPPRGGCSSRWPSRRAAPRATATPMSCSSSTPRGAWLRRPARA